MDKAVFLDRDGVINRNVYNPDTGVLESPHRIEDFELFPWTIESIRQLKNYFKLFLVSNQPSFAKRKTSLENIQEIHNKFLSILIENGLEFDNCYYCYHHPEGSEPAYSGPCECRKPNPFFLRSAEREFTLDMTSSWMVGDRITDIQCGKAAGVRTIFISDTMEEGTLECPPDFTAVNLKEASNIILNYL